MGRPRPGEEARFTELVGDHLVPAMRQIPGVAAVRCLWPYARDGAAEIHCQVLVEYASEAERDRMLASPERAALLERVRAAQDLFEGELIHIEYRVS